MKRVKRSILLKGVLVPGMIVLHVEPLAYPMLCFKSIWITPSITVLPSGTLPKLWT